MALLQARSGIARSGATRSGYFTPNMIAVIDAVTRTSSIIQSSLSITLSLNNEPDLARFTLKPGSTLPSLYDQVVIALGTTETFDRYLFNGSVVNITRRHEHLRQADQAFYEIECIDLTRLFNRPRVNRIYRASVQGYTLSQIVTDVIGTDAGVQFNANFVQTSAVVPDVFVIEDMTPGEILTEAAQRNGGGGWYIDASASVHWFGASGETYTGKPTPPVELTKSLSTLKAFSYNSEGRELRNRVIVKGRTTKTLVTVPNDYTNVLARGVPVEESWMFEGMGDDPGDWRVNFGAQVFKHIGAIWGADPPAKAQMNAAATPGDTSITIVSATEITGALPAGVTAFWLKDEAGNVFYATTNTGTNFDGVPASGYGAITAPIANGTQVYLVGSLRGTEPADGSTGFDEIQVGEVARVRREENNTTNQAAIAAIEGGSGIHMHVVEADVDFAEGFDLGQAELALFANTTGLPSITWTTTDMNAKPGSRQPVNVTDAGGLTGTITIDQVEITFPLQNAPPFRRCLASNVKFEKRLTGAIGPPRPTPV